MVASSATTAVTFSLSPAHAHDAPDGRLPLGKAPKHFADASLLMDRAYEDNQTRQIALDFGFNPVVPPKSNRLEPWEYDKQLYKRRNEIERLFRRLKA